METETLNGTPPEAVTLEPSITELKPPEDKKKKKNKKKKSKLKHPKLKALHYLSEGEGSSKLSSKEYEKELGRLQVELVK
ncbi:MAG: polyphosphate kinase 2, partial [Leptolyngbyaceae cyanobacterium CAN_BIN12]|nr:polyphosphate kinase 2 [Leptolyngbyaceae cyanobacterium CAN_BIN12]